MGPHTAAVDQLLVHLGELPARRVRRAHVIRQRLSA